MNVRARSMILVGHSGEGRTRSRLQQLSALWRRQDVVIAERCREGTAASWQEGNLRPPAN